MATDLQIIDGIERLRRAFYAANPEFVAPELVAEEIAEAPEARVAAAWLCAVGRWSDRNAEARRQLRAATRALLAGELLHPPPGGREPTRERARLQRWGARFSAGLERARRARLHPLTPPSQRSFSELASAWSSALPGLTQAGGWRILALLGHAVLAPLREARRFLWRYGALELASPERRATGAEFEAIQSEFERWQRLSGLSADLLLVLLRWHVGLARRWSGGAWCVTTPRCAACPLAGGCAFARFRQPEPEEPIPQADAQRLAELRERVLAGSPEELGEAELLALLLPSVRQGTSALELAVELLRRFGSLVGIERASPVELEQVRGLAPARIALLKGALELGRRLAAAGMRPGDPISSSADIYRAYRNRFIHLPQEYFVVVLLDAKHRVISDRVVSKGTLTGSLAHPREVFHQAVRQSAASIILIHNHPSGDPAPSAEDRAVTRRLKEAGEIMGIKVLDHIILGTDHYHSFADHE